eukprot:1196190-Prorocentrum_minimum.AAC.2
MKRLICAACLHISKPCELEICTALISRRGDEFEAKELYRTRSLICGGHGGVRTAPSCYWPYRDYVLNSSDPNASRDFPPMEKKWRDLMYVQPHPLFIQFHMPVHMGFAYVCKVKICFVVHLPHASLCPVDRQCIDRKRVMVSTFSLADTRLQRTSSFTGVPPF